MQSMSEQAILGEIGARLRRERLNQNLTQAVIAERAGVRQPTIPAVERGDDFTMGTFIGILRGLGRLEVLEALLPEPASSPTQLAQSAGRERQRARAPRTAPAKEWVWGDEA